MVSSRSGTTAARSISLWRSVFVRLAWDHISEIEKLAGKPIGQGNTIAEPPQELLEALTAAYQAAIDEPPTWNGRDFYVAFGEGERREWEDARRYGFVSAGGGAWYSRSLQQLKPENRVFAYIPKGRGVGGYVGVGEVTAESMPRRTSSWSTTARRFPISTWRGLQRPGTTPTIRS